VETFFSLIRDYMGVDLRGPFNRPARMEAGFSSVELDRLASLAEGSRPSGDAARPPRGRNRARTG
jgi:hypothetical protein